ncbi:MAG TPA: dienelactone hydrolase family protein [Acidimicrobiales bacterium]|nr:dienelactone hydrolase family protein [Acidimicrobiales bacterium]
MTKSGMPVVMAIPEGNGPFPSMILMHERYGLVQHTIDIGKRLAANGYLVAAPDLYYEHPDQEALHAGEVTVKVADAKVNEQLEVVADLLQSEFSADLDRLAVMGVCASGRYSLAYAAGHRIRACITFYGGLNEEAWSSNDLHPIPMEQYLADIEAPILGVYGERDHTIPIDDVLKLRNALEERNKSYQITVYPDVPHGWLNDTMPGRYRREAAEQTWKELLSFLEEELVLRNDVRSDPVEWKFRSAKHLDYDFHKNVRFE